MNVMVIKDIVSAQLDYVNTLVDTARDLNIHIEPHQVSYLAAVAAKPGITTPELERIQNAVQGVVHRNMAILSEGARRKKRGDGTDIDDPGYRRGLGFVEIRRDDPHSRRHSYYPTPAGIDFLNTLAERTGLPIVRERQAAANEC